MKRYAVYIQEFAMDNQRGQRAELLIEASSLRIALNRGIAAHDRRRARGVKAHSITARVVELAPGVGGF